jgi:hypothetical protein
MSINDQIEQYLLTGESDPLYRAWPGGIMERANRAHEELRGALVRAVRERSIGLAHPSMPDFDAAALTRAKVGPMVRGLFPRAEQQTVLATLAQSVVFLTGVNIEHTLRAPGFDSLAWDLANLYLASLGAKLLGQHAPLLVGLSQETTCYVSFDYFTQDDPFADFIVHEVAHIFHNCKRATLGLPSTRAKVWLLDIEYAKREAFAYACEAFSRLIGRAKTLVERRTLADAYSLAPRIADDRVDATEVSTIIQEAAAARNGWKVILSRCAPPDRSMSKSSTA